MIEILRSLPPRHLKVLCMRFGLYPFDKEHTLEEVGRELGVTRERIRQIETKTLSKISRKELKIVELPKDVLKKAQKIGNVFDEMKKLKTKVLTPQEENGIYELLAEYLFNKEKPPIVGAFGISPYGYKGLIHLWKRLNKGRRK